MAVDADGTLLVAGHGSGNLHVFDAGGGVQAPVELGVELGLSNLCFAGDDLRRLVVTAANTGEVLELSWAVPGLPCAGRFAPMTDSPDAARGDLLWPTIQRW